VRSVRRKTIMAPQKFGSECRPGVLNEAVGNECEGDDCAPDNDGTQTGAAGFGRLDTYATDRPCAPEAEPPACPPSLDVIELADHRLFPVEAIGRKASSCEGEQLPRSIRPDPTTETVDDRRNHEEHCEPHASRLLYPRSNSESVFQPARRQAVKMARRPTHRRLFLPLRIQ
jgi:hypothetical protein